MDHRNLYKTKIKSLETRKADRKAEQQNNRIKQRTERFTVARQNAIDESVVSPEKNVVSKKIARQNDFLKKFDDWRIKKQKIKEIEQQNKRKPFSAVVPSGKFLVAKVELKTVLHKNQEIKPIYWNSKPNEEVPKISKIKNSPKLKKMLIKAKKENQAKKILDWKTNYEASKKRKKIEPVFQMPTSKVVKRTKPAPLKISNTENMFQGVGLLTSTNRKQVNTKYNLDTVNSSLFEGISPIELSSQSAINTDIGIESTNLSPIEKAGETVLNTTFEKVDEVDLNTTPLNNSNTNNKYLSPFVTTARGKGSVKRERVKRESIYKPNSEECDDVHTVAKNRCKETANYFKNVLEKEILRLNERCSKWILFKEENQINITEDGKDMIDVAVGQTKLLINKKFQQFRGLIDQCESLAGDNRVLPEDLEGFWDMIYKQAENLDERYDKLDKLKENNWEDLDITTTAFKKKNNGAVKKRVKKPRNDDLMKLIKMGQKSVKERQQKEKKENREKLMDSNRIITPGPSARKSLLVSVISSEARKTLQLSPTLNFNDNSFKILSKTDNVKVKLFILGILFFFIFLFINFQNGILKKERNTNRKTVLFIDETPEKKQDSPSQNIKATPKEITESHKRRTSQRTPKPKISFCDANHDTPCSKKKYAQTPVNKRKYSVSEDSSTPRRNSIMTTGGLFMEDQIGTPLSTRQSTRLSARRSKK